MKKKIIALVCCLLITFVSLFVADRIQKDNDVVYRVNVSRKELERNCNQRENNKPRPTR